MAGRGKVLELSSHLLGDLRQDTSLLWVSYRGMWEWGGEHVKGNTGALTN